jgi:hypothetical protein
MPALTVGHIAQIKRSFRLFVGNEWPEKWTNEQTRDSLELIAYLKKEFKISINALELELIIKNRYE